MAEAESGRSSVTLSVNAKGARQWTVKLYLPPTANPNDAVEVAGELVTQAELLMRHAMELDAQLAEKYGLPG